MGENDNAAPGGDDAAYAALAAELEAGDDIGGQGGDTGQPEPRTEPAAAKKAGEKTDGEPDGGDGKPQQQVPYEELDRRYRQQGGALKEAREAQRQLQQQLQAFNDMVTDLRAARQQPAPQANTPVEPEPIDPHEDPIGWMQQQVAGLRKELQTHGQTTTEMRQAEQARGEYQQFMGIVEKAETAFASKTPDYHQAIEHLENARRSELALLYPDDPRMDAYARQNGYQSAAHLREAVFQNDAQTVARTALAAGINPAEAYYNLARGRGYVPVKTPPAKNGAPAGSLVDQAIDAARRGQKAAKTIGGGAGKQDAPVMSMEDLTELYSEDPEAIDREFDRMAAKGLLG